MHGYYIPFEGNPPENRLKQELNLDSSLFKENYLIFKGDFRLFSYNTAVA